MIKDAYLRDRRPIPQNVSHPKTRWIEKYPLHEIIICNRSFSYDMIYTMSRLEYKINRYIISPDTNFYNHKSSYQYLK